jgi:hypothetical protein
MQYNDGRFKNKPPATIFIYQHTTLGVIPTPHRSSVYLLYKAGRTDLPAPTPDAQNGYNSTWFTITVSEEEEEEDSPAANREGKVSKWTSL